MQYKSSNLILSNLSTQRIHNKVLKNLHELVWLDLELECGKGELENIMRWEDEGGSLIDTRNSTHQMTEMNHKRMQR